MKKRIFALLLCLCMIAALVPVSATESGTPLKITAQPQNVSGYRGDMVTTKIVAEGDGLTYQWYVQNPGMNYFHISSVTTSSYSFEMVQEKAGRKVYCVVSDQYGNQVTSSTVTFTMRPSDLKILRQPVNATGDLGQTVSTAVEAEGVDLRYQWYVQNPGMNYFHISSVTTSIYSFDMVPEKSGRKVYCVITDRFGVSLRTDTVSLTLVQTPLVITGQPQSGEFDLGETACTAVEATGINLRYQWYVKNPGMNYFHISSVTTSTYCYEMVPEKDGRQVYCIVTDLYGETLKSDVVTLKMPPEKPEIRQQPENTVVDIDQEGGTSVVAAGRGLTYQWYLKDKGMAGFAKSSLSIPAYHFTMTLAKADRQVYCVITDRNGNQVKTQVVTFSLPPADTAITTQPQDAQAPIGETVSTTVEATGRKLQYQWYIQNPGMTGFAKSSITDKTYSYEMTREKSGRKAYCIITDIYGNTFKTNTVTLAIAKGEFSETLYKVKPGGTKALELTVTPENADPEIVWLSSNSTIAKVDQNGVVTGVALGTVTITATGKHTGFIAKCQVKVCNLKQIALTYDDGPASGTMELLNFLRENNVKVTFFMVGNRMNSYSTTVKQMAADGHELGYHSYAHQYQTGLSSSQILSDFNRTNENLKAMTGREFTVWRTPGGNYNSYVLNALPLPHIMWSVDTRDWATRNSYAVYSSIINNARDGSIILLHDLHYTTVTGSKAAIAEMIQSGDYEFLTVTELLSRDGTPPQPHLSYTNG